MHYALFEYLTHLIENRLTQMENGCLWEYDLIIFSKGQQQQQHYTKVHNKQ